MADLDRGCGAARTTKTLANCKMKATAFEDEPGRLRLPGRTDRCVSVETRFVLQAMIVGIGTAVEREVHRRSQRHISYTL